jgi:hypothetical protein
VPDIFGSASAVPIARSAPDHTNHPSTDATRGQTGQTSASSAVQACYRSPFKTVDDRWDLLGAYRTGDTSSATPSGC